MAQVRINLNPDKTSPFPWAVHIDGKLDQYVRGFSFHVVAHDAIERRGDDVIHYVEGTGHVTVLNDHAIISAAEWQ